MAEPEPDKFSKDSMIRARLADSLRQRLDRAHLRYKTNDTDVVVSLLVAFCDEAERVDAVRFPITLRMAEIETPALKVADEAAGNYHSKKTKNKPA